VKESFVVQLLLPGEPSSQQVVLFLQVLLSELPSATVIVSLGEKPSQQASDFSQEEQSQQEPQCSPEMPFGSVQPSAPAWQSMQALPSFPVVSSSLHKLLMLAPV
jgi:hypothetical protein